MGLLLLILTATTAESPEVWFQAHRGGLAEVPENTLYAYEYAWGIPGAVPEIDVCTTADGQFICLHDDTLERTTDAPDQIKKIPVSKLSLDDVRSVNAAVQDERAGVQRVPLLTEVLALMRGRPERLAYFDMKNVDLDLLQKLIDEYGVEEQVIFVHGSPNYCQKLAGKFPRAKTMTWLSGGPDIVKRRFDDLARDNFKGISQLQFHLRVKNTSPNIEYELDRDFLKKAAQQTRKAGVELQLRPFKFDPESLGRLMAMGTRWFVTDEPKKFAAALDAAKTDKAGSLK